MRNLLTCLIILLALSACKTGKDKTISELGLTFVYDTVKVESKKEFKKDGTYISPGKATILFPVFKNDSLNQFIKRQVFNFFAEEEPVTSYQEIADSFIEGYDSYANSKKGVIEQPWSLMIVINVQKLSPNFVSLKYIHFDYAGGAHGNTNISFINYNPETNKSVSIDSLIINGKMEKLVKVAEAIFRKNEKLNPQESLEGKYFFDKGKFALAKNYFVSDKGLVFLYNPYEIKAYAEGYTEVTVPFSALNDIAKPNTILTTKP